MEDKKMIAFCPFCEWTSISKGYNFKIFGRKNISAPEILYEKLYNHLKTEHSHIIMEVWMNN